MIDANILYGELLRLARMPGDTKLVTLAKVGFLHILIAAHVADELDEHLEQWCLGRGIDHAVARERWTKDLRPFLTVVTLSSDTVTGLLTRDEAARLKILAESADSKFGDADDVPTAVLALLLQAPLLSKDSAPLKAVYGPTTPPSLHAGYLKALTAGGQLHILGELAVMSALITGCAASGGYQAVRGLTGRIGPIPTIAVLATLIALLANRQGARGSGGVRLAGRRLGAALTEVARFSADSETTYATLVVPKTPRHEIADDRRDLRLEILAETRDYWSETDNRDSTRTP